MPKNTNIPTDKQIESLPQWARVAFAARCARRVLPLFRHCPEVTIEELQSVVDAIRVAENAAAHGTADDEDDYDRSYESAAYSADAVASANTDANDTVAAIARAAANAADAAADAFDGSAASYAANAAAQAVRAVGKQDRTSVVAAIRADYQHLRKQANTLGWDDDTAVLADVFGPMWPSGVPKGWPEEDPIARLSTPLALSKGPLPETIADFQVRLHAALNKLAIANGGTGLSLDSSGALVPTQLPKPREQS